MPDTALNSLGILLYLAIHITPQGFVVICAIQTTELKLREINKLPKVRELICSKHGI